MLPIIDLGGLKIPSYSLLVLIGAIFFTVITIIILEKVEKTDKRITNRLLVASIFGFASLYLCALIANSFFHSIEEGRIIIGGIAWLGGVLGAFPIMIFLIFRFCKEISSSCIEYFNLLIPGITLAHGFGRIGCFLAGCCYGKVTDSFLGISFPEGSNAAEVYPSPNGGSLPVIPTQLYEAVFELILFIAMMLLYKKLKKHFVELYCFTYGVFRFILEFWRGDDRGETGLFLSPSQLMSIVLIVYGILLILYHKDRAFKKLKVKIQNGVAASVPDKDERANASGSEKLRELNLMLSEELISQEEYEQIRKQILENFTKIT